MRRIDGDYHLRVLVESMSRAGRTEQEIVAAVGRAGGPTGEPSRQRDDPPRSRRRRG
jgi:hypothetical protein